jgi:hypothetical protein
MNTNTDNKGKEGVLKTLAIGGFVGLIIIIAWLGIQLISFMPSAFTSLASLADSVYNYKPVELVVVTNKSVANSGEAFTISWNKPKQVGSFSFSYVCTDGVAAEVRTTAGAITEVPCDEDYSIGSVETLDISMTSERNRFTEVPYVLSFMPAKSESAAATSENKITVVNAMISPVVVEVASSTITEVIVNPEPKPVVVAKPEVVVKPEVVAPKPTVPAVPKPVKPAPKPAVVSKPVYGIPTSNPNGVADVSVKSLGAGTVDSNNRFTNVGVIDNDQAGAIQFEIRNIGTKTSNAFTYTTTLPSGVTYTSPLQPALKPNERIVATIGFDASDLSGIKTFSVAVTVAGDANTGNNVFNSAVKIND